MPNNKNSLKDNLMNKIESGKIKPIPGIVFSIKDVLAVALVGVFIILGVILINFLFHEFRFQQPFQYLLFEGNGIVHFLQKFPFVCLFLGGFVLLLFMLDVKGMAFYYKGNRILFLALVSVAIVSVGFAIDYVGVNELYEDTLQNKASNEVVVTGYIRLGDGGQKFLLTSKDTYSLSTFNYTNLSQLESLINKCVIVHGVVQNKILDLELINSSSFCK